jgi:hypothetical protein
MTGYSGPIGPRTCEQQERNGLSENSMEGNDLKGIANFHLGHRRRRAARPARPREIPRRHPAHDGAAPPRCRAEAEGVELSGCDLQHVRSLACQGSIGAVKKGHD